MTTWAYEDGTTYAWTMVRRIGACSTDRAAVVTTCPP
jgi:hypothetical protein